MPRAIFSQRSIRSPKRTAQVARGRGDQRGNRPGGRNGQERPQHDCSAAHRSGPARLQPLGRQPDPGGLRAALHRQGARRWSSLRVANTALGAISFLALEAIGGAITVNYGFTNATAAILAVGALIFLTGLPIAYYAASYGVDIDLLTRGAGFGYIGSTITSLIYASFTFMFFAIEAAILSLALELCFGVPLPLGYMICSLVVIPLVTHGITFISRLQLWTQPIWIVLHVAAVRLHRAHRLRRRSRAGRTTAAMPAPTAIVQSRCCSAPPRPWCSR